MKFESKYNLSWRKIHRKMSAKMLAIMPLSLKVLTHWGRVMHICVGNLTIISSDNGLSPGRHQAIIWTDAGILLIWPLATNFSEILIKIRTVSFKKMRLKVLPVKWRPICIGLNVLTPSNWCKCNMIQTRTCSIWLYWLIYLMQWVINYTIYWSIQKCAHV